MMLTTLSSLEKIKAVKMTAFIVSSDYKAVSIMTFMFSEEMVASPGGNVTQGL